MELSMKEIEYERLKKALEYLKGLAETVENYEDSVYADYRNMAEHDMREIIDTLINLEL